MIISVSRQSIINKKKLKKKTLERPTLMIKYYQFKQTNMAINRYEITPQTNSSTIEQITSEIFINEPFQASLNFSQLVDDQASRELFNAISQSLERVNVVNFSLCFIPKTVTDYLVQFLKSNQLTNLTFSCCVFEDFSGILEALALNNTIETLGVQFCHLSSSDISAFFQVITPNKTIKNLTISPDMLNNCQSSAQLFLERNECVTKINVDGCDANDYRTCMKQFELKLEPVDSNDYLSFLCGISKNTIIRVLQLSSCGIKPEITPEIVNYLVENNSLTELDIKWQQMDLNQIDLWTRLISEKNLTSLSFGTFYRDLSNNASSYDLTANELRPIALALSNNSSLVKVSIGNYLKSSIHTSIGILKLFLENIESNKTIVHLDIGIGALKFFPDSTEETKEEYDNLLKKLRKKLTENYQLTC